jgi:hypothetical protein
MNQPFQTELTTYRTLWRGQLINNEYHYTGGDNYDNIESTQILSNIPEWYNTNLVDNDSYYQNETSILHKLIKPNNPTILPYDSYNTQITYDNTTSDWIIHDTSLHTHTLIVTDILNEHNFLNHLDLIREHYHYDNVNEIINKVITEILEHMNIDG